ncbi:MAG: glycosyltransferase family 2 protein [Chloroflexota bacterium]
MRFPGSRADIDVIIVHYHAAALVREAVDALKRDAKRSGLSVKVIVADNGSTPDERAVLQALDAEYLPTGRDAGYAGGANFAFARTHADTIILMNEDVMVLPGCLQALRNALKNGAAVAGPEFFWDREKVFLLPCTEERSRHNELLKAAGKRSAEKLKQARQHWREHARRHWRSSETMTSTAITGALLAFRRDTWTTVGGFDEGYQLYFDENDWLFRVERAGLQSVFVPEAKAFHLHNPKLANDPDRLQWSTDSFLRFGNRYYGETFMKRLFCIGGRPSVMPDWKPLDVEFSQVEIEIPTGYSYPLWVELTPSPFGYPAAAARITDAQVRRWKLPEMQGLHIPSGTYYLQLVDDAGREILGCSFQRNA